MKNKKKKKIREEEREERKRREASKRIVGWEVKKEMEIKNKKVVDESNINVRRRGKKVERKMTRGKVSVD